MYDKSIAAIKKHPEDKLLYLEGVRGLMAFNVILCHFVSVYYPQLYYLEYAQSMGGFLSYFARTPLSILVNGNVAVKFFFVLTGFLVGRSFFTKNILAKSIPTRSVKRYLRLLPMVFVTTVFTFLTMRLDLQYHLKILSLVHNGSFLERFCNFTATLIQLPENIFLNPFIGLKSIFVGPFWTIYYELWGYIFCMVLCLLFKERKYRRLEYIAVILLLLRIEGFVRYIPFVLGVIVADLIFNTAPVFCVEIKISETVKKIQKAVLFGLGCYCASCPIFYASVHEWLQVIPYGGTGFIRAIGVSILLWFLLKTPRAQKLLSWSPLIFLGEISFEVYAFHWPVMLSFQAWLFGKMMEKYTYDVAALTAFLLSIPVIYVLSYIVHIVLDRLTAFFAHDKL